MWNLLLHWNLLFQVSNESKKKRVPFKGLDFCIIINSQSEDFPFNTLPSPESTQYVPKKKYELPRVSNRSNDSLDLKTAIAYP